MSFRSLEEKSIKFERIANNFISSIFKSVIMKYNKEKEIVSKHVSLSRKEENNKIIVSNFVNELFKETKNEFMNSKIKSRNISNKKCYNNHKSLFISSNKKITNTIQEKYFGISCAKSEYNTSNKNKRIFKANSNISCETNVSTFDKENKYVTSFNTSNKKKGKKINIQSDYVVSNLYTGFIPVKEKYKVNYNLDEKLKITKRKQESNNNKILFLKYNSNKSSINLKKENDFIQKVFKYDNNRKKIHKIKKENDNANIDTNNYNKKNCSGINQIYKHIILKNSDNNKNRIIKVHRNNDEKNSIQKINIVKVYNKKVIQQRTKIFSNIIDNAIKA